MPPKRLLLPLPAGSSHITFKFSFTRCIFFLIYRKPACQKHFFFSLTCMAYENNPISFDPGGGMWLQLCPVKLMVLVSHWLPNCTRRINCGECASASTPQKHIWQSSSWPNTGWLRAPLTLPSVALTNCGRHLLSVWTQLLTLQPVALRWPTMLTMLIICLSLHFAVITVIPHGRRSTNTRSILAADWVRRKELALEFIWTRRQK